MSDISHSVDGISLDGFLAAEITVVVVTSVFIMFRLFSNFELHKRLLIDDYFTIIALLFLIGTCAVYYPTIAWLNDPNVDQRTLAKVSTASYFVAGYSNFFAKSPLLLLYTKIFSSQPWVRRTSYITLVCGFLGFTATSIAGTLENPGNKVLDLKFWAGFLARSYGVAVANAVFNLCMDIVAFVVPLPIIYRLQLPIRKKLGLALLFMVGLVAIVSGAVSLHYRRTSSAQTSEDLTVVCVFTILDSAIGIILGCVPALRALWNSERLGLMKSLRSVLSSTRMRTRTSGPAGSQTQLHSSEQYGGQVNSWVEIGEMGETYSGKNTRTTRVTGPMYEPGSV